MELKRVSITGTIISYNKCRRLHGTIISYGKILATKYLSSFLCSADARRDNDINHIYCVLRTNTVEITEVMFHQSHYCLLKTGEDRGCRDDDLSHNYFVLNMNTGDTTEATLRRTSPTR